MRILGIESSCDETAAAVVEDGRRVLSSVVHTQIDEHAPFGGVVPEIAGRSHLRQWLPTLDAALDRAGLRLEELDGIAVTSRPGLIGSLLVGLSGAKSLAFAQGLPWVTVDHIEAHVHAATMESERDLHPAMALVVSGGHTSLFRTRSPLEMTRVATTLDDAAGEAFDKVAHLLGLAYPGGPSVSKLAADGDPKAIPFPRYHPKDGKPGFSFSGLKTAVLYHLRGGDALAPTPDPEDIPNPADVAASFQEACVDTLVRQTLKAAKIAKLDRVVVGGGVACNQRLRVKMTEEAGKQGIEAHFPSPAYCTDNAAMIAGLGWHLLQAERFAEWDADAFARSL